MSEATENKIKNVVYTTSATSAGGRDGHVKSDDGAIDMDLKMPAQMGGTGGATTPEQLFAAGYAACFNSALNMIARMQRMKIGETRITVEIDLGKTEEDMFQLAARIKASIPGADAQTAHSLMEQAHNFCPYSRATRGNMDVKMEVIGE